MSQSLASFLSFLNEDFDCYCSKMLVNSGLSKGQLSFLVYIGDHPNCSPTELANAIDADSGYTTRSVKKLVASGMAIREKHKDDGRAYVLRLTSLGMEKAMAVREMYASWEEEVTCDLDEDEREALLKILSKLGRV